MDKWRYFTKYFILNRVWPLYIWKMIPWKEVRREKGEAWEKKSPEDVKWKADDRLYIFLFTIFFLSQTLEIFMFEFFKSLWIYFAMIRTVSLQKASRSFFLFSVITFNFSNPFQKLNNCLEYTVKTRKPTKNNRNKTCYYRRNWPTKRSPGKMNFYWRA